MKLMSPMSSMPRRRPPSRTELQWVPHINALGAGGATKKFEWAAADRELGHRDWVTIDPQPVRKSSGVANCFTPALYFWQRTGTHVWCESQEERWQLLWLDFGGQIERVWSQPLGINFGRESKLFGRTHVPDHMVQFVDGSFGLFDTKHPDRVDDLGRVAKSCSAGAGRSLKRVARCHHR